MAWEYVEAIKWGAGVSGTAFGGLYLLLTITEPNGGDVGLEPLGFFTVGGAFLGTVATAVVGAGADFDGDKWRNICIQKYSAEASVMNMPADSSKGRFRLVKDDTTCSWIFGNYAERVTVLEYPIFADSKRLHALKVEQEAIAKKQQEIASPEGVRTAVKFEL